MKKFNPYKSFWMGGFEGADHINARQDRLDMVQGSGHDVHVDEDYSRLQAVGIETIRESVGWRSSQPTLDSPLDLSRTIHFAESAKEHGIQVMWTFMHYGTPDGVDLKDDSFIDHFTNYAVQVAKALAPYSDAPIYNLINEISFLSWALAHTDFMHPYTDDLDGFEMKQRLVRAVLSAMKAVKEISPGARFLHVEPIMHVAAPVDQPELIEEAAAFKNFQWQTFDMLQGIMCPELGGSNECLDLIGVNYYYNGQIEFHGDALDWKQPDPRRIPFSQMLNDAWLRYDKPLIISETGHFDEDRARWLDEVLQEVHDAKVSGVPVLGVCIYPVLDRPCWHEPDVTIRTGLIQSTESGRQYHLASTKIILRWKSQME
jgi:beta-glucosidase/6-phospho-beta-glucosidase/beta-galactosidase